MPIQTEEGWPPLRILSLKHPEVVSELPISEVFIQPHHEHDESRKILVRFAHHIHAYGCHTTVVGDVDLFLRLQFSMEGTTNKNG